MLCGLRGVFLLDKQGRIRWTRVGEGDYDEAERLIQKLLAEKETGLKTEAIPRSRRRRDD